MAVAGSFYPADPAELGRMIDGFLAKARRRPSNDVVAIVSPHAGYEFAGPVAAYSYALLKGRKFDRVVVIAPSHYEASGYSSVYDGAAYTTPLGQVPVDHAFAAKLAGIEPANPPLGRPATRLAGQAGALARDPASVPAKGDREVSARAHHHGRPELRSLPRAGRGAGETGAGHQHADRGQLRSLALSPLRRRREDRPQDAPAIEEWDYLSMSRNFEQRVWEACGGGPIIAAMIAAERLGANQAKVLKYLNSGDTAGDKSRVVGYGAVAFVKAPPHAAAREEAFSLSRKEQDELLRIARAVR